VGLIHFFEGKIMEKLIYLAEKKAGQSAADFSAALRGPFADAVLNHGVHGLQINVVDDAVAPGAGLRQCNSSAMFDTFIAVWVDSWFDHKPLNALLAPHVHRFIGYAVSDSQRIPNTKHKVPAGERGFGFSQVCTLQIPPRITREAWFDIWQQSHGTLAIETQSTFRYVQNIVQRRLTWDAPVIDAVVEECFPLEAMTSQHAFYDAVGDDAKYQANYKRMMDSCARFIDVDKIDCILTSEYVIK
jgi:hypothetical protein